MELRGYGLLLANAMLLGCSSSSVDGHGTTACTPTGNPTSNLSEFMTSDHRYVVAVGDSETERIFLGPLDHLVEGRVTTRSQANCGDEIIEFVIDGSKYSAVFPAAMCTGIIPSVFDEGDDLSHRQQLTAVVPQIPLNELTLYCF